MLLLIPPVGLDRNCWDWLSLPEGEVARYEPPGIGARCDEAPKASLSLLADEIAERWTTTCDVVGVSFGGMIAQALALRHPERVRSLLLAATTATVDGALLLGRAEKAERFGMAGVLHETLERWFSPGALNASQESPALSYTKRALRSVSSAAFAAGWRAMSQPELLARLGRVGVPTTCLAGKGDVSTPIAALEAIAAIIPGARVVCIEGPHMLHLEAPGGFSAALVDHLAWVRTRS